MIVHADTLFEIILEYIDLQEQDYFDQFSVEAINVKGSINNNYDITLRGTKNNLLQAVKAYGEDRVFLEEFMYKSR